MEDVIAYLPLLLQGLRMTLTLAICTLLIGLVLGMRWRWRSSRRAPGSPGPPTR